MTGEADDRITLIYVLFGSDDEARRIARDMIERRLAACANILGSCHSIYRWQDRIEEAGEVAVIFKTSGAHAGELGRALRDAHSYDVPAIVTLGNASTYGDYRDWLIGNLASD